MALPTRRPLRHSLAEAAKAIAVGVFVLGVLLVLSTGGLHVGGLIDKKEDFAKLGLRTLCGAVRSYAAKFGHAPSSERGLAALVDGQIIERLETDPWGRPYRYALLDDSEAEVSTLGSDGATGGDGPDTDLILRVDLRAGTHQRGSLDRACGEPSSAETQTPRR